MIAAFKVLTVIGLLVLLFFLIRLLYRILRRPKIRLEEKNKKLLNDIRELTNRITVKDNHIQNLKARIKSLETCILEKDELYKGLQNQDSFTISKIISLYSDFLLVQYEISQDYLLSKPPPAYYEAMRIQELKKETQLYVEQFKHMQYKYEMLFQLFPELTSYVDDYETIKSLEEIKSLTSFKDDFDRTHFYLSNEEYKNLGENERNQLALDKYIKCQKSKWQIGRDYELFIGQEYEKNGWNVEYFGLEKKLKDMGRDLIIEKGGEVNIIQCKYWSQDKVIHEKHIAQLYGSAVEYELSQKDYTFVKPVFITSTALSETAMRFANKLGVQVIDKYPIKPFPRIKCNINKDEFGLETRIYHLPFDQQYDRTKIYKKDEFYAFNVQEAVDKGFRRAFRYFGE
jgi:hypothetical protein